MSQRSSFLLTSILALAMLAAAAAPAMAACPCTIWPSSTTPATAAFPDNSALEVGVKFRSDQSGYIKALRFYKGTQNTATHTGSLWSASGTLLASATFTNETASGWQQVDLPGPVAIQANTTYVASYHTDTGFYAVNGGYFASTGVDSPPLHALSDTAGNGNGVYRYGAGAFPDLSFNATNYWVDVVFDLTAGDTTPPTLTSRAPSPGQTNVPVSTGVTAGFSEPVQPTTISMRLNTPAGTPVPGSTTYNSTSRTATFTPTDPLAFSTTYTATVSGATDASNNTMSPDTWTFTTDSAPPPPSDQGPGGPVLLVTSASSDPFTSYYTEILRTEGLNEFRVIDVGALNDAALSGEQTVVLANVGLSSGQVTTLTNFANAGGNVIATRPDPKLAGLLGITSAGGTRANAYLAVDRSIEAASGIVPDSMQYHGTADLYTLSGATAVANLWSDAGTATTNPAVTVRTVGTNGGQAAAFTYDLARSVIYTRQGNPAWAGQSRDGGFPIRAYDQFFGGSVPDWVDLAKVAIPSADEQQRLMANLIETMNRHRMPLPRFWYFPRSLKAVIIGTGDDHGGGGTRGRFNQYLAASPAGCSVADWTCPRFGSYVYTQNPLGNSAASTYNGQGFEVGLHPDTGCDDYTLSSLSTTFTTQLSAWRTKYRSLPSPTTNRTHCVVWSDWSSQPTVEKANGMRLDGTYYYWPASWVADRPGMFTGSGMPMRFVDTTGKMIDDFQAPSEMTDESGQSYPATPDALLDAAQGPQGFYGAFNANLHTDSATTFENDEVMASAQAHQVPIVAPRQMLAWLDGRNASSFQGLSYGGGTLAFTIAPGPNTTGLTAMVPTVSADGVLTSLTRAGTAVGYTAQTIKGIEYAIFPAASGSYSAQYGAATAAIAIASVSAQTSDEAALQLNWDTSKPASTEVAWGESPDALNTRTVVREGTRRHRITLFRAAVPGRTYYYRVISGNQFGVSSTYPATTSPPASFTLPARPATAPAATGTRLAALPDGTATVTWATDQRTEGSVEFGTSTALGATRLDDGYRRVHRVVLDNLVPGRRYYYRVVSSNSYGMVTRSAVVAFDAPAFGVADSRIAQWQLGQLDGVVVGSVGDGALRLAPGSRRGTFVSRVLDAQQMVGWRRAIWDAAVPAGTTLSVAVRSGSTSPPDSSWTDWVDVPAQGALPAGVRDSRYLQYRIVLTSPGAATPLVRGIGVTSTGSLPSWPGEGG